MPIDQLFDAQTFAEKLFAKLRNSKDRYEIKLHLMRLIARLIGRHKLMLLSYYEHIQRYLGAHTKDQMSEILAMIIESCHELVPPENIKPLMDKIISNFITEYCQN